MSEYIQMLEEGINLKRAGKYNLAKEKYIEAIKIDSKQPIAYYNLGKILYILNQFDASARAYKTSFELGVDPYNVLIHLGHSILDEKMKDSKYKNEIKVYQRGINPYIMFDGFKNNIFKTVLRDSSLSEYENICIQAAKEYLNIGN